MTDLASIQVNQHVLCDEYEYRITDLVRPRTLPHKLCARLQAVGVSPTLHGLIPVERLRGVRPT